MKLLDAKISHENSSARLSYKTQILVISLIIAVTFVILALILNADFKIPIGPMYWDTYIYFDAIHRLNIGQLPFIDFNAPVGPMNYWLASFLYNQFPNAQPLLIIHWSLFIVTAPLMLLVSTSITQRSFGTAIAILLPFILFSIFPFGTVDFFPFPGTEGFAYYNRHGAIVLYVLTTTVFFVRNKWLQAAILAICGTLLMLGKITAFIAALVIVGFGFIAGFVAPITVIISVAIFAISLLGLELYSGIISAYLSSIWNLATSNQSVLLPRFLTVFSQRMDVILASSLLIATLFFTSLFGSDNRKISPQTYSFWLRFNQFVSQDYIALSFVLLAGIFYETQNTGSQAFIMIWPLVLLILQVRRVETGSHNILVFVLAMAAVLPTFTKITHKALRTAAVAPTYQSIESRNLGVIGNLTAKNDFLKRIEPMQSFYIESKIQQRDLADKDILLSSIIFSEPGFQISWLELVDDAIDSIYAYEETNNVKFETVLTLDFTNIFPFLMNRNAPKYIQIGADANRTLKNFSEKATNEIMNTDIILRPTCPILPTVESIYQVYKQIIDVSHKRIKLNDCYDAYIKKVP